MNIFTEQGIIMEIVENSYSLKTYIPSSQEGCRAGVPTSNKELEEKLAFYVHTTNFTGALVSLMLARCSMPPTSWGELRRVFRSVKISLIFHFLFDQT